MESITSVEDGIIIKEQSKFYLERLLEKGLFKDPSKNYYVNTILLTSAFTILGLVVTTFTGEITKLLMSWWFYAGFISPLLGIILLKYLRDKAIDCVLRIKPMLDPERWKAKYLDYYFRAIFGSEYQLIAIIGAPLLVFMVHYYNYYMGLQTHSFEWETCSFIGAVFVYIVLGLIALFCIGVGIILFNTGRHVILKEEYALSYDRMGNLKPMASLGLVNALTFVLPISVFLPALFQSETVVTPLFMLGIIVFIVATFVLFVYPVYSIHRGMVHMKTKRLAEINRSILELREKAIKGKEPIEVLQFQFEIQKTLFEEVKAMREWPIQLSTILSFIGTLIVPLIPLILKYLFPTTSILLGGLLGG